MGQFAEFYNLDLLDVNTPPDEGHVRLFRNKNAARNPVDGNAAFLVKHSDGYLEPLSTSGGGGALASVDQGSFTISADGSTGSINGVPVVPVNNLDGTWTMTIPTVGRLELGHFNAQSNLIVDIDDFRYASSYGKGNLTLQDCLVTLNQQVAGTPFIGMFSDFGDIINVGDNANNGWQVQITNISDTSYDILWQQNGTGLLTFVQWHGVMS